ncbi:AAA family ATPase [Nostoc sp. CCY 9925]|uniref:AAA family ATPase n=1 Tax=Nostoc sp. CCY 9925 TaxID=3103865 RepID=UPI0039C6DE25
MPLPHIPSNTYTNAPEQHPNLILGSLQILFWLFFRPTALRNYLKQIFDALEIDINRTSCLLLRLRIQVYLVLPFLVNLTLGLTLCRLEQQSVENIPLWVAWGVAWSVWLHMGLILMALRMMLLQLEWFVSSVLVVGITLSVMFGVSWGFMWSVLVVVLPLGTLAFFGRFSWSWFFGVVAFSLVLGIVLRFVFGVPVLVVPSTFTLLRLGLTLIVFLIVFLGLGAFMGKLSWGMFLMVAFSLVLSIMLLFVFGVSVLASGLSIWGFVLVVILGIVSLSTGLFGQYRLSLLFSVAFCVMLANLPLGLGLGLPMWGIGVTINLWRPAIFYPFVLLYNSLLYQLDKQRKDNKTLLRWHSAFWDELQYIPLIGLDKHLILVIERNPVEGQAAVNYLNDSRQRWATKAAQIELDIRKLERCADMEAIRNAHSSLATSELGSPVNTLLSIFNGISQDVNAALNQKSINNQRQILNSVVNRLNAHLQEINRSSNEYAPRLYPIAQNWFNIISNYIKELIQATELLQEIDNPYIIGVPLNEQLEIFTGRTSIGLRIEQLLLDHRRPPLLLYGQRRMGKTSLLNNIGKLLPNSIISMFIDLQGAPSSASDHAGFLYNLARDMEKSAKKQGVTLPSLAREVLKSDPFTYFYEWLDKVEQALEQNTALLALDEFEVLDNAIAKGRFDEQDILGMLRHLIQHRPRFKVLLAGSHTIEEYQRWASYLINVQVVHISYLKEAEARQLIERPVKDFTLRYEPNAVERVLQLTRCHPFLVQLLCAEIIVLKNEQDPSIRRFATLADVEAAIPEALQSGGFFFADIQNNQVDTTGQAILRFIAAQGEGVIVSRESLLQQFPDADITLNLLLQRELIEEVEDSYSFQVELIRRWFA